MRIKRTLKQGRIEHIKKLMSISSIPENEKKTWNRLLPSMNTEEINKLQVVLEREITDLADIYLKVMQRKQESRGFDYKTEYGEDFNLKNPEKKDIDLDEIKANELGDNINLLDKEKIKEIKILKNLINGCTFIASEKKKAMIEVSKYMPIYIIKDFQDVIIREGLRSIKKNIKAPIINKNLIVTRGYISRYDIDNPEYILETLSGNKYNLVSKEIDLEIFNNKRVELKGVKEESFIYIKKIHLI